MGKVAAFFDIDGTIFRNSLMIQHFRKMIQYEVIDPYLWHSQVKKSYYEWENRFGDYEDYLEELAEVYVNALKGINKNHIDFIANQVINLKGGKVYRYARSRIKWHKDNNHLVFFISGSPDFLVSKMAEKYNATEYRGSVYLVDENNNFTGEIFGMWDSDSKQRAIGELVSKYDVDLDKSYSYGDTNGDYSMLKMVGNPIAINPNGALLKQIKENQELADKTTIILERKDIIYKVKSDVKTIEID